MPLPLMSINRPKTSKGAALPTQTAIHLGDIFDVPADCLVCSANVFLTLSGGVGGEFLRRFGRSAQTPLQDYLAKRSIRYTTRGDVVATRPDNTPYRLVLHAVTVDGMYDSSQAVIQQTVRRALDAAAEAGCTSIVFPALATGYGHLTFGAFLAGYIAAIADPDPALRTITLALRHAEDARLAEAQLAPPAPAPAPRAPTGDTP